MPHSAVVFHPAMDWPEGVRPSQRWSVYYACSAPILGGFVAAIAVHPLRAVFGVLAWVGLMDWIVRSYSLPGQTVLDCFAGSCVTVEAAVKAGRHAIGIERDPSFFAKGCDQEAGLGYHRSTVDR